MGALIKNFNNKRIPSNPSTFIGNSPIKFIGRFPIHRQIGNPILKSPFLDLIRKRLRPVRPPTPQSPAPQPQSPAPQQPPQIENMPQIIPDLSNRFPFTPFQPPQFNDFDNLDFTSQDFTYTPSNLDFSQPTIPRFNYPIIDNRFGIPRTDEFGMPRIIPTELINRISKFPRLRFPMPRYPMPINKILLGKAQLF